MVKYVVVNMNIKINIVTLLNLASKPGCKFASELYIGIQLALVNCSHNVGYSATIQVVHKCTTCTEFDVCEECFGGLNHYDPQGSLQTLSYMEMLNLQTEFTVTVVEMYFLKVVTLSSNRRQR